MSRPSIVPEVLHLLEAGESPARIASRLDRRVGAVGQALHRAGLTPHARPFWAEANRLRGTR